MAQKYLNSSAISAFCTSVATMLAAGIQTDEAVRMLSENRERSRFTDACDAAYGRLIAGDNLADAMRSADAFPPFCLNMVRIAEETGRTENVLRNLGRYYAGEERLYTKLKAAVSYPAGLLCVMTAVLAFTVAVILPGAFYCIR